jgi:hypothetical protein
MPTLYVLWWQYSDHSAAGIERVYEHEEEAQDDCTLLNQHATVQWQVTAVPFLEHHGCAIV